MPSIAPLNPQQIADLYGALDDFVGTGDNVNAIFNTAFFPVVIGRNLTDDLIGLGDGIATAYNTNYFCDSPRTIQNLKLYRTSVADPLNELTIVTHYTANTTTGAITLTPAGVTFLGLEQFHASYVIPSTVELHTGTIAGPLLVETTDYTIDARRGKITLTAAGISALALNQLHATYYTERGSINVIDESVAGLGAGRVQIRIRKLQIFAKSEDLREIHEAIEANAILDLELERRNLTGTYVAPGVPPGGHQITEAVLVQNVTYAYKATPFTGAPLFPPTGVAPVGDPAIPDLSPSGTPGLHGGATFDSANESSRLAAELASHAGVIAAGADVVGFPGPVPVRSGWYLRYDAALVTMIPAILAQNTALANQVSALTAFLVANPVANDHISASDISDATAASLAATAQIAANTAYLASIPYPSAGPFPGMSTASITAEAVVQTARQAFVTSRDGELTTLLTFLWGRRIFWIGERARLGDGTLFAYNQAVTGDARVGTLLSQSALRRQSILDVILAQ